MTGPVVTHESTLRNGTQLYIKTIPDAPVALYLWFEVGCADESPSESGMAHFLEHMLFKGTPSRGIGQAAREIEGFGGDLNAWTSHDQLVLHATVQAPHWSSALDILVDMVRNPLLDPGEFASEAQVVVEEIRGYANDPEAMLSEKVQEALWGEKHPYSQRVLGTPDSVSALTPDQMRSFLHRHLHPGRLKVAVVGTVDPEAVKDTLGTLTEGWQPGEQRTGWASQDPNPSQVLVKPTSGFHSRAVEVCWSTPAPTHEDAPALEVLAAILGQGHGALLTSRVQLDAELAFGAWASVDTGLEESSFSIGLTPLEGKSCEALTEITNTLQTLDRHLTDDAVQRAKSGILTDFLFAEETVDSQAHDLVWYASYHGSPSHRQTHQERLSAVTRRRVLEVANRWLSPERAVVGVQDVTESMASLKQAFFAVPAPPASTHGPQKLTFPNGVTLLLHPSETPICAFRLASLGGDLSIPTANKSGIGKAWARMVLSGAGEHDAQGVGETIDRLAATLDPIQGRQTFGFSGSCPAHTLTPLLDLLRDLCEEPHFDPEDWSRTQSELLDDLMTQSDRPNEVCGNLMRRVLWGTHPWRYPRGGTQSSVRRMSPRTLAKWHKQQLSSGPLVLSIHGRFDPESVIEQLTWLTEMERDPSCVPQMQKLRRPQPSVFVATGGHEQAIITLAMEAPALHDELGLAYELLNGVLEGQGGRLFLELREAQGLAYEVWSRPFFGLHHGLFTLGIATSPERVEEASRGLHQVLAGLVSRPISPQEHQRALRMLQGRRAIDRQQTSWRATESTLTALLGLPEDANRDRLSEISLDTLQATALTLSQRPTWEFRVLPLTED